ncbi:Putative S-adenosyl-L-methionine-dependent methyltransferase, Methyltransferase domain 25 [Septoria linicola]|uniref:S-adenosyl-L-methionine-dependent methyltransferase, Methyltransferase domain 25 n=1 Tax=Septoria linicola TaxID=215465 RepID=A0A9Q9AWC3_9PEZI|nr:putative S-adenosyl-L-methionine-dependent methyltransferase, Methyltransferase domain 25 [Septoria linicola]USW57112.1 Putative S-adenosyl-L-methionine-dependent methyltransferase, Methyltransferase domain 25 [Septoria linicola]
MTSNGATAQEQYDVIAKQYATRGSIPHSKLEFELCKRALGDCTGYRVLDLAGGTGVHSTFAIEAGASHIDVVDISDKMMHIGVDIERQAGRDIIRWHKADIIPPLKKALPDLAHESYDLVLAMWPWDYAGTFQEYVGIWRNVAAYLKPGGRLIGSRIVNPWGSALQTGKYGAKCELIQQTEAKGVKVLVTVDTEPPFRFESVATEASLRGETYVPNKLGIVELCNLPIEETATVKADPDFWKDCMEDPYFAVFTGKKKSQS